MGSRDRARLGSGCGLVGAGAAELSFALAFADFAREGGFAAGSEQVPDFACLAGLIDDSLSDPAQAVFEVEAEVRDLRSPAGSTRHLSVVVDDRKGHWVRVAVMDTGDLVAAEGSSR